LASALPSEALLAGPIKDREVPPFAPQMAGEPRFHSVPRTPRFGLADRRGLAEERRQRSPYPKLPTKLLYKLMLSRTVVAFQVAAPIEGLLP